MSAFDAQLAWLDQQQTTMQNRLPELTAINSGSWHTAGLRRMADSLCEEFAVLGTLQRHPLAPVQSLSRNGTRQQKPLGDLLTLSCRADAPVQLLLVGHYDTVFAADHPFQQSQWLDNQRLNGPGAADLKGGLLVMKSALMALEQHPEKQRVGWTILLNPDEEVGSPGSATWLQKMAATHHIGLCFEPSLPNGNLVSARKGSGNFSIQISGRAAHAGRDHAKGRNAISAMADVISTLDQLNGQHGDMTVNVGFVDGGGSVNVVPDECLLRVNVRVSNAEQMKAFQHTLQNIVDRINQRDGLQAQVEGSFHRPPKVMNAANEALLKALRDCGCELGLSLQWQATGGCCDGNNLAHHGLPNVDNLGVRGDFIHSDQEYCLVDSLSERAKLSALLMLKLASQKIDPAVFGKTQS